MSQQKNNTSKMTGMEAVMIGSAAVGMLDALKPVGKKEKYYNKRVAEAIKVGNELNAKKEELLNSFEHTYNELASKHNLQRIDFNSKSQQAFNTAYDAFVKYGETELIKKYDDVNKQFSSYINKNKTLLDQTVNKISGGKIVSLSSLAEKHNDNIDKLVSEWTNAYEKDIRDKEQQIDKDKQMDSVKWNDAQSQFKNQSTNKINEANDNLSKKQQAQLDKLNKDKFTKYNNLNQAMNAVNDWYGRIQQDAGKYVSSTWDKMNDALDDLFGNKINNEHLSYNPNHFLNKDEKDKVSIAQKDNLFDIKDYTNE